MRFNNYIFKTGDYVIFNQGCVSYCGIIDKAYKDVDQNTYTIVFRIILDYGITMSLDSEYYDHYYIKSYIKLNVKNGKEIVRHMDENWKKKVDETIKKKLGLKYDSKNNLFRRA